MRRSFALLPALLLPALTLAACAPTQSRGPDFSALSGNYVGTASLGPIPAPYQLLLNVNGRTGRADGVLTRTSNGNVYSASGTFRPFDANGGMIELKLFSASRQAGTLSARVQGDKLDGFLKTGALTFTVKLTRSRPAQPDQTPPTQSQPAPGTTGARPVPTPSSSVTLETTQTETTTSVPVYVIPTPVTPPHP
ncbi:hypothetical protein [Deinococcus alpinitundrae]|uniref:hypothetical protein n=1 Tax=Deinococcus alpinitundrae TaxID=468913 RepID=UPI00137A6721|nr:hypothetical protein [Deinococcus alpinitundrae]